MINLKDAHSLSVRQVLDIASVDPTRGLSSAEARKRLQEYGPNELPSEEGTPLWKLVLEQFDDLLVKILLAAAAISFMLAISEGDSSSFVEPFVILTILIANAVVGVWQESNAEKAIEALKTYQAAHASVLRDGVISVIPAVQLVPGDIVEFAVGHMVPADCRVIELLSTTIRVDQAPLTGESVEVMKIADVIPDKDVEIQAKTNIAFSGTMVNYGKARAVVIGTGINTAIGQVHKDVSETETDASPLKKRLDEFGELLTKFIGVICVAVWLINLWAGHFNDPMHGGFWRGAIYYFKIAVALAVAAIPEGLPAVVTTCLALGTRAMAKRRAIVRSLPSVETLGCTTVICSDKTGTLTTNMMSVARVVTVADSANALMEYAVADTRYSPIAGDAPAITRVGSSVPLSTPAGQDQGLAYIALISAMCNDASISFNAETRSYERVGEATEAALRVLVEKIGLVDERDNARLASMSRAGDRLMECSQHWASLYRKEATLEFSRDRKSMSVLVTPPVLGASSAITLAGNKALLVKGAPESILARCNRVKLSNGRVEPLTESLKARINTILEHYGAGSSVLRCLGLAYVDNVDAGKLDLSNPARFAEYEANMTFVGVVGMLDPPRPEVRPAIETCRKAGIRVMVITGDNKATAEAICRRIGVFGEEEDLTGRSFTGREFDALSDAKKVEAVMNASLFCRVEPSHKMKLVELLQAQGEICAMTGDGVNDAPALKKANIGVAMGSGTAVAKGASDMVLADDNFATIVGAVEQGRSIFANTKQFIRYLISSNIGEVVCIFLTVLLGMPEVLVPVQLLWVNLVTDGLPATALGFNPPDKNIMKTPPRSSTEPIVDGWMLFRYIVIGTYVGIATIAGYAWWLMSYEYGPLMSWEDLTAFSGCTSKAFANGFDCSVFTTSMQPATMALSVLVTIEMFNALNALSENESLLSISMPPWANGWLLAAISTSFALHFVILEIPVFSAMFGVTHLNWAEWKAVVAISFPVVIIDEVLKFISRNFVSRSRGSGSSSGMHKKQR